MFQKLERVGPLIGHVDQAPIGGQTLGAEQPQPTFPRLSGPQLRQRFLLGDADPAMQNLVDQADHVAAFGRDRQTVMAQITPLKAAADLSQLSSQRLDRGEIQFGAVVQNQDGVVAAFDVLQHGLPHRGEDGGVRHFIAVAQAVQGFEILGRTEFVGQRAARMFAELIGQAHQAAGASQIAQLGVAEHRFSKGMLRGSRAHERLLANGVCRLLANGVCRTNPLHPTLPPTHGRNQPSTCNSYHSHAPVRTKTQLPTCAQQNRTIDPVSL